MQDRITDIQHVKKIFKELVVYFLCFDNLDNINVRWSEGWAFPLLWGNGLPCIY